MAWVMPGLAASWPCLVPRSLKGELALPTDLWQEARPQADRADVSQKPGGRGWRLVSSVVPSGTCVALCRRFLTLCSPLQAQRSGKGEPRVTPSLPVPATHSACPPPAQVLGPFLPSLPGGPHLVAYLFP